MVEDVGEFDDCLPREGFELSWSPGIHTYRLASPDPSDDVPQLPWLERFQFGKCFHKIKGQHYIPIL
eukprot:11379181-Heterocapsa_arctica.AAC.1